MGLREKVILVVVTVILFQITARHCMPKNINMTPLRTNRLKRISAYRPTSTANNLYKAKVLETEKDKTDTASSKYSRNLLNKLIKEGVKKYSGSSKVKTEPSSALTKPFATTPQPYCFKDVGTFPDVEYPMFITDMWVPNYWKMLPNSQPDNIVIPTDKSYPAIENVEEATYIRPSNKAIDKAIRALIKYKEKSKNEDLKGNIPDSNTDSCPLEPPNQCSPAENPQVANSTSDTLSSGSTAPNNNYFDPHPTYGTYLHPSEDELSNSPSSIDSSSGITSAPYDPNDITQLSSPIPVTPEYGDLIIPTATTAMPPFDTDGEIGGLASPIPASPLYSVSGPAGPTTGILPANSLVSPATDALVPGDGLPTGVLNPVGTQAQPITDVLIPSDGLVSPATDTSGSIDDLSSPTGVLNPVGGQAEPITDVLTPSDGLVSPTTDTSGSIYGLSSPTEVLNPVGGQAEPITDNLTPSDGLVSSSTDTSGSSDGLTNSPTGVLNPVDGQAAPITDNLTPSDGLVYSPTDTSGSSDGLASSPTGVLNPEIAQAVPVTDNLTPSDSLVSPATDTSGSVDGLNSPTEVLDPVGGQAEPVTDILIPSDDLVSPPTDVLVPIDDLTSPSTSALNPIGEEALPTGILDPTDSIASPADALDPVGGLQNPSTGSLNPDNSLGGSPVDELSPEFLESVDDGSNLPASSIVSSSLSSSSVLSTVTSNSISNADSTSNTLFSDSIRDVGSDDYEFATMPPDMIPAASDMRLNPDDTTTKLSPGDDYFMLT